MSSRSRLQRNVTEMNRHPCFALKPLCIIPADTKDDFLLSLSGRSVSPAADLRSACERVAVKTGFRSYPAAGRAAQHRQKKSSRAGSSGCGVLHSPVKTIASPARPQRGQLRLQASKHKHAAFTCSAACTGADLNSTRNLSRQGCTRGEGCEGWGRCVRGV